MSRKSLLPSLQRAWNFKLILTLKETLSLKVTISSNLSGSGRPTLMAHWYPSNYKMKKKTSTMKSARSPPSGTTTTTQMVKRPKSPGLAPVSSPPLLVPSLSPSSSDYLELKLLTYKFDSLGTLTSPSLNNSVLLPFL